MTNPHAISWQNVSKSFNRKDGGKVEALRDVSLDIERGEFVSIVGWSGCGKSTLLKLTAGLIKLEEGQILRDGSRVTGPTSNVSMVFQAPELLPWRNALDNVLLPAALGGRPVKKYRQRATDLLKLVELDGFEDSYPHEMSGGMQQRNALARSLLLDPSVLLLDEPFGALDALTRDSMAIELQKVWLEQRFTAVFVTHAITEAVLLSDRVVVMSSRPGQIIDVVDVPFPRPRTIDLMGEPEFGALAHEIRRKFKKD